MDVAAPQAAAIDVSAVPPAGGDAPQSASPNAKLQFTEPRLSQEDEMRSLLQRTAVTRGNHPAEEEDKLKLGVSAVAIFYLLFCVAGLFLVYGLSFAEIDTACRWAAFAFMATSVLGCGASCLACTKSKQPGVTGIAAPGALAFSVMALVGMLLFGLSFAGLEAVRWTTFAFACLFGVLLVASSCLCCKALRGLRRAAAEHDVEKGRLRAVTALFKLWRAEGEASPERPSCGGATPCLPVPDDAGASPQRAAT